MYPRTLVPDAAVTQILGILGTKRPIPLKLLLLRWIINVFDSLESKKILSACYGVLFHFLGYDALRFGSFLPFRNNHSATFFFFFFFFFSLAQLFVICYIW
jgi:hypothetical protein